MTEMETILNTNLTRGYPGEPLKYLINWETAAIRLQRDPSNEDWSDSAKRKNFAQRLSILG